MNPSLRPIRIAAAETRALRRAVLRPHQPSGESVYPLDARPETRHVGIRSGDRWIGVGSVFREPCPDDGGPEDWRIRGMAVDPGHRGCGHGSAILGALLAHVREAGGVRIWCNARETASGFYLDRGFRTRGEVFDLPGLGPHRLMDLPLSVPRPTRIVSGP